MGIFSRLNDIVNSNLNALLDKAENPEKIIRLVVQEMEDTLVEVRSDAARAIADRKKQQRRIDRMTAEMDDWEAKAKLALDKDREDLARAALLEKHNLGKTVAHLNGDLEVLEEQLDKLNDDIARLQEKLDDARARQQTMLLKTNAAGSLLKTKVRLHDNRLDDALVSFDRLENKIDKLEGQAEAYEIGRNPSLQDQFAELEVSEEIDAELENLKSNLD